MAEHLRLEEKLSSEVFMSKDAAEGLAAFREKRKPRWRME
jgi:enoyl-CoA hydratase/carnithine racemase